MKYCKNCGKEFEDDDKFCDGCGGKLVKKEPEKTIEKKEEWTFHISKMRFKFIAVIILVALCILLGIFIGQQMNTGRFVSVVETNNISSNATVQDATGNVVEGLKNISGTLEEIQKIMG